MKTLEELLASGNFKALEVKPFEFSKQYRNGVTSIYDKMHKSWYEGVAVSFLFQFDIGYVEWAIKNMDDFCLREYDYLPQLSTFNTKIYEMRHIAQETVQKYRELSNLYTDEEILVAMGGQKYFHKLDVKKANDKKLERLKIKPEAPRLLDRTYLCINRTSFPDFSGIWEYEGADKTNKGSMMVYLKKGADSNSSVQLLNNKLGMIINVGPLAYFKDKEIIHNYNFDFFRPGELVRIGPAPSTLSSGGKYLISKI